MLIDKYLPGYDVKELHSISLNSSTTSIYETMLLSDIRSPLMKLLFRLRGMPNDLSRIEQLTNMGFIKLDEKPGTEVLYGMVTNSPTFNCCFSNISPADFIQKADTSIIKAVINFHVQEASNGNWDISTETRVWCGGRQIRAKFKRYWFFVKPFSQLIRKSMLRQMKKQILNSTG
ncbi:MAG: hypothetical protein EOP48_22090 [Sphingobacteriales bacterium]|nr:MAG: hypothetical protein EOP48_22090 [Sphingobacteriales bacterium]